MFQSCSGLFLKAYLKTCIAIVSLYYAPALVCFWRFVVRGTPLGYAIAIYDALMMQLDVKISDLHYSEGYELHRGAYP